MRSGAHGWSPGPVMFDPHNSKPRWAPRLVVMALTLVAAGWSAKTIDLETELLPLLPADLPSVRGLNGFAQHFSSDREVILVAPHSMPEAERHTALETVRPALASLPGVESVAGPGEDWLAHAPRVTGWAIWNLPPASFQKVMDAIRPEAARKKLATLPGRLAGALDAEQVALHQFDPLGVLEMVAPMGASDGGFPAAESAPAHFLTITSARPLVEFQDCIDFCDSIQATVESARPGENRLLLTGRPAFTAEISQQMRRDMRLMIAVAVVLVSLAFWAFYRTLKPLVWILWGQFLALGVALVAARAGVGSLNVISMGFACILLGISMDYSILVYHHFASGCRAGGAKSWRRIRRGIWFSAATTAAAFLVLAFSSIPGLRQLAILVAAGLLASAFFATWLLPAAWSAHPPDSPPFLSRASDRVAMAIQKWGTAALIAALLAASLAGARAVAAPGSLYAPDLNRFQPTTSAAFRGQMELATHGAEAGDAIFLVQGPHWDAVQSGAHQIVARFPGHPISPATALIPAPSHQLQNSKVWPPDVVDSLREAFAEAGLGEEWSQSTLDWCAAISEAAKNEGNPFAVIQPLLGKIVREAEGECQAVVRVPEAAAHPVPPGGISVGGATLLPVSWVALKDEVNQVTMRDFARLATGVTLAILLLCYWAHQSVRLVVLNVAALAIAMLLFVGLVVMTGTQLSVLSLLCVPLLLGLVVDYSLHVLMALEHEQGKLKPLYAHIGAPILLTGLASCIGFGAPMLASQPALRNFGLVMDLGIIAAVTTCLFFLPVLARWMMRWPPA